MAQVGLTFLSPSTAPSPVKTSRPAPSRQTVVPIRRGPRGRGLPQLRSVTPQGAQALRLRDVTYPAAVSRVERATRPQDDGGGIIDSIVGGISAPFRIGGGLLLNGAREMRQIIPGTGRLAYENIKDIGQMALSPLPGIDFAPAANRYGERTAATVKGFGEDVKYSVGPILRGDPVELARRFYREPIRVGGTLAMLYSAAGQGAGAALRGTARATGSARLGEFASKRTAPVPDRPVPRRYREPERIVATKDRYGREPLPDAPVVQKRLRPRSSNIVTREIQRNITDPAISAVKRGVGRIDITTGKGRRLNPMSNNARYERIGRANVRATGQQFLEHSDDFLLRETANLQKLVRKTAKQTRGLAGAAGRNSERAKQAYYTAAVRAMGLNNLSSKIKTRTWGRDSLIRQYEAALKDQPNADYARMIEDNLSGLRSIPDEWLDPATAPDFINQLTKQTESVLAKSTELKQKSGVIQPMTAERSGFRAQEVAAGVFDEASAMRTAIVEGRRAGAKAVTLKGRLDGVDRDIAATETKIGASPKNAATLKSQLRTLKQKRRDISRERNAALKKERENKAIAESGKKSVDRALGADMKPGQYFPNFRQQQPGIRIRVNGRPLLGESPRMTLPRERINEGVVLREGTAAFSPDISMAAIRDAVDVSGRAQALTDVLEKYVVRGDDGVPITDERAINIAKNSNSMYVAKTKKELIRILRADAKMRDEGLTMLGGRKVDEADVEALLSQLEDMPGADTHYLIPRFVEKGWRDALGTRQNIIDDLNGYWKAGVLALSPRWYIQNGVGMSLQFFLGAGLDLRAMRMAASKKYVDDVLAEIDASGLSGELGQYARQMSGKGSRNPLKRLIIAGYRANAKLESLPRRAMYWHAVKKNLRQEEMLSGAKALDDASLIEAWKGVADSAKKGEQWAVDLVDDIVLETDRFMGQYSRYNPFERTVLRRIFPFYGWMRAINRLAFMLPFKYPKRAALLASASRMAYEMYGDEESSLMSPMSGFITGANNDYFVQTNITNPAESFMPTVQFAGEVGDAFKRNGISAIGQMPAQFAQTFYPQVSPIFTDIPQAVTGRSALDVPLRFGPGSDNSYRDPKSGRTFGLDPISNEVVDKTPRLGAESLIGSNFPMYQNLRRALAGGNTPNADTSLADLIRYQINGRNPRDAAQIIQPPSPEGEALTRTWWGDLAGGIAGVPVYRYSSRNALLDQVRMQDKFLKAYMSDVVQLKKNEALFRRSG